MATPVTYTVVWGDTLSGIAARYGTTVNALVQLNNISNPNFIVVGQVLRITSGTPGPTDPPLKPSPTQNLTSRVVIDVFGLQSNTDRTMYATWVWNVSNTDYYKIIWYYETGDGVWFIGSDTTTKEKQAIYSAPANAKSVKFKVQAISTKREVNKVEVAYWTCGWSTESKYAFVNNPPTTPGTPTVEIDKFSLTASLTNLDVNGDQIQFQIVKDDSTVFNTGIASIKTSSASYKVNIEAGHKYKVRARAVRNQLYSGWSEYSENASTIPSTPSGITTIKGMSETSVYLEWPIVQNATTYDIEMATELRYFDSSNSTEVITGITTNKYEKTGMSSGDEYFFRVRAVNANGNSGWTAIKSVTIGVKPAAPTTWSSTTTAITGTPVNLYWVHNTKDGSPEKNAQLELYINGVKQTIDIPKVTVEGEDENKNSVYTLNTSSYTQGTKILWRVRTAGVTLQHGAWSTQRTVEIFAPPTLSLTLKDSADATLETLTRFPFYLRAVAGPSTQRPIGYHVEIISNQMYETVNEIGEVKTVNAGEAVYDKHFTTDEVLVLEMSAGNIDLENNISYTVRVTVSMNSGLTTSATGSFNVAWTDETLQPNAEIGYNQDSVTTYIRPFCEDVDGNLIEGVTLSVYRREFDGEFKELVTGIQNTKQTFVSDPHPSLDFARYRIVAITDSTGAVSFYDVEGFPIQEKAIIIQWDEAWSDFDMDEDVTLEDRPWSGSLLRLPYNIEVSESTSLEVSHVDYIGRKRPVSYYGTHLGETASWNVEVPKYDKETIYALRRLAIWMGDVYVREPSGAGYWATVSISMSQSYDNLIVPVDISITRVEGGI